MQEHVQYAATFNANAARRPVPAAKVNIPWTQRPLTWGIVALLLCFACIGYMGSGKSHASQSRKDTTDITVEDLDIQVPPSATATKPYQLFQPAPQPRSDAGQANVTNSTFNGSANVGTNNGSINITNNWGGHQPEPRVIEKVTVIEKPVYHERVIERPVFVERPERPIVVQTTTVIRRDAANPECEDLHRQNRDKVAAWKSTPLGR